MDTPRDPATIKEVHILRYGYSLCRMEGWPQDWPEGHLWVDVGAVEDATCKGCLAALEKEESQ